MRRCETLAGAFESSGLLGPDSASVDVTAELALSGDLGLATNNFYFADEVSVRYTTQIHSAEVNRVCCCCSCDGPGCCQSVEWLQGFRYLNLNEEFSIVSTDLQEGTSEYE